MVKSATSPAIPPPITPWRSQRRGMRNFRTACEWSLTTIRVYWRSSGVLFMGCLGAGEGRCGANGRRQPRKGGANPIVGTRATGHLSTNSEVSVFPTASPPPWCARAGDRLDMRPMLRHLLALFLAACVATVAAAAGPTRAAPAFSLSTREKAAAARVTAAEISGHTRFLSDELLEGRFPGTRGEDLATRYLAAQLEGMGFQPGVPGQGGKPASWFQPVPLVKHTTSIPASVTFLGGGQSLSLATGPALQGDLAIRSLGDTDRVDVRNAELVFVGYGIVAPEYGWDDYRGVDVKGKVVVLLNFNPPFAGERVRLWYGRWDYKYMEAARHGAVGALLVHTTDSASYPWQVVVSSNRPEAFALPPEGEPRLDFQGWIAREGVGKLFQLAGRDFTAEEKAAQDPGSKGARGLPLGVTT